MQTEKLILKRLSDGNFILMDNSEIKYKDWYIDDTQQIRMCVVSDTDYWKSRKQYKKIIRSTIRDAYGQIPSGLSLSETRDLVGEKTELEVYFDEQGKLKLVM